MEDRLIRFVLFSGFLSVLLCSSHDYVWVRDRKTWKEAQDFCQKHYLDLATARTDEEWSEIDKLRAKNGSKTWIRLYDDVNGWRWSFRNECPSFTRWHKKQPDNYGGNQDCVMLHSNGYWHDENCNRKCAIICQSDQRPVLVSDPAMSWTQGQRLCRENYTDLHTVKNERENQLLQMMVRDDGCVWIGLYRHPDRSYTNQTEKQTDQEECPAVDEDGRVTEELCSEKLFFVCQTPLSVRRQVLRLKVKAGDNVSDKVTADAVLKEVQKKLQEQGLAADVKFSWQEQLNGTVFHKLNKQRYRSRC
ncbi:macrophage mannose receptor 1-like [Puntigrus tetrazona]|uniref:macrophage mannose receptor 1-like n=1 Tax=Puntigrus tetrazona TaxID=1606681 RepID=UPI001C89B8A8|nr:macrophage mannose receptor 1-like [Puntigrus tetrazona]